MQAGSGGFNATAVGCTLFVPQALPGLPLHLYPCTDFLVQLGRALPRPAAVLVVSATWQTPEPIVAVAAKPASSHDLYQGGGAIGARVVSLLGAAGFGCALDCTHTLDAAASYPLHLMCPAADIPVLQLSIQPAKGSQHHFDIGVALAPLAQEGVLVMGTGLAVHNLREATPASLSGTPAWAQAFDDWLRHALIDGRYADVIEYRSCAPFAVQAQPAPETFLPLLIATGAAGDGAKANALHRGFALSTLSLAAYSFVRKEKPPPRKRTKQPQPPRQKLKSRAPSAPIAFSHKPVRTLDPWSATGSPLSPLDMLRCSDTLSPSPSTSPPAHAPDTLSCGNTADVIICQSSSTFSLASSEMTDTSVAPRGVWNGEALSCPPVMMSGPLYEGVGSVRHYSGPVMEHEEFLEQVLVPEVWEGSGEGGGSSAAEEWARLNVKVADQASHHGNNLFANFVGDKQQSQVLQEQAWNGSMDEWLAPVDDCLRDLSGFLLEEPFC